MTTFYGHLLPGLLTMLFGVWWTINIFKHFFVSKYKHGIPFRSRPWYPGPFGANFPIEIAIKVAVGVISTIFELVSIYQQAGSIQLITRNVAHITIHSFLTLNAVVDLLKYKTCLLPDGIEAASGILLLAVEAFLITGHVHDGRPPLSIKIHTLFVYAVLGIILSIFLEVSIRDSVVPALSRAFFMILHGTWLCQVGAIIDPTAIGVREWDMMDHDQMMIATLMFTWHMAAILVGMLLIGVVVWLHMKHCHQLDAVSYHMIPAETYVKMPLAADKIIG